MWRLNARSCGLPVLLPSDRELRGPPVSAAAFARGRGQKRGPGAQGGRAAFIGALPGAAIDQDLLICQGLPPARRLPSLSSLSFFAVRNLR